MNLGKILTVLCVVLLSSSASSESKSDTDEALNFLVFVDDDVEVTKSLISMARKQLKATGKDTIGKPIIISLLNYTEVTFGAYMQQQLKKWEKSEEKPLFVFDFTQRIASSVLVKHFAYMLGYPIVSTNQLTDGLTGKDITPNVNSTLQLRCPDRKLEDFIGHGFWTGYRGRITACLQSGITVKLIIVSEMPSMFNSYTKAISFTDSGFTFTDPASKLPWLVDTFRVNTIFTYGTAEELTGILKGASKRNLFDDNHAWWALLSDSGEDVVLPKGVDKVMLLIPEFSQTGVEKSMKSLNTKSISDLFYVDVITATVQTIGQMKKDGLWKEHGNNLRTPLSKHLEAGKGNIFGKYVRHKSGMNEVRDNFNRQQIPTHSSIWEVDIKSFKAELLKPGNRTVVGKFMFTANGIITRDDKTHAMDRHVARTVPPGVAVVVDPPFVIKNETCVSLRVKTKNKFMNCYSGFVIDILEKIRQELRFNYTFELETTYGELQEDGTWAGARGALSSVQNEKRDIQIGLGAFTVFHKNDPRGPQFSTESEPFYYDQQTNKYYGFAFGGSTLRAPNPYIEDFNYMIKKLKNQRYLQQLQMVWMRVRRNATSGH